MGKVIKRSTLDDNTVIGELPSELDASERTAAASRKIISSKKFEAKADAQSIREKAESKADEIVTQAQEQAQQILEDARQEAESIMANARQEGYEAGRQEGANELSEVVASFSARFQKMEAQIIPQLKQLAVTIARKILGREIETTPEVVVEIIKQALSEKARQRREIFLRVNPDDLQTVREQRGDLLEVLSRCKEIGVREDPDVAPAGCIIETEAGIIDAQLETQLAIFERVLKDA